MYLTQCLICDCSIVICKNIYLVIQITKLYSSYIFGLCPEFLAFNSQNPWNFLSNKSNGRIFSSNIWSSPQFLKSLQSYKVEISVLLFITSPFPPQLGSWSSGGFWEAPKNESWSPEEPTLLLEDWNLQSYLSGLWRREERARSWINCQWPMLYNRSAFLMKLPQKLKMTGFWEFLDWWTHGGYLRGGMDALHPFSIPYPMDLFHLVFLSYIFWNKPVI